MLSKLRLNISSVLRDDSDIYSFPSRTRGKGPWPAVKAVTIRVILMYIRANRAYNKIVLKSSQLEPVTLIAIDFSS